MTIIIKLYANPHVVKVAHTAPGHSQKKEISPGFAGCHFQKEYKLKYVKGVSCVTQLSCVKPVTNVKNVASNLPVGARLQNFWQTWGETSKLLANLAVSNRHKLLCQPPQEPLPAGDITSAYRQKRSRACRQSKISGILQPTIPSATTQQQVETYTRSDQTKPAPQGRKIQNGDTGNHQDVPPARGVGYLNRFQGCLLPYTNTGTVQEISEISCAGSDIPVQGTAIRFVHSAPGVHCNSKGDETDVHTQGYNNPPVPRRMVGESQIPPNLSPAYTGSNKNVSGFGLAGEF